MTIETTSQYDTILEKIRHEPFAKKIKIPGEPGEVEVAYLHDTLYIAVGTQEGKTWTSKARTALRDDSMQAPGVVAPPPPSTPSGPLAAERAENQRPASPSGVPCSASHRSARSEHEGVTGGRTTRPSSRIKQRRQRHLGNAERLIAPKLAQETLSTEADADVQTVRSPVAQQVGHRAPKRAWHRRQGNYKTILPKSAKDSAAQ